MKRTKQIICAVLALVFVLSLASAAFASTSVTRLKKDGDKAVFTYIDENGVKTRYKVAKDELKKLDVDVLVQLAIAVRAKLDSKLLSNTQRKFYNDILEEIIGVCSAKNLQELQDHPIIFKPDASEDPV